MSTEEKVIAIIEHIRPYINADGGDIEFVKLEDNIVYVNLTGACAGCGMLDVTLNEGVKGWIMDELPEIEDVVLELTAEQQEAMDDPAYRPKTLKEIVDENLAKFK